MEINMAVPPKLVCFDWDGTLIDSFDKIARCIFDTAKLMGLKTVSKNQIKAQIGQPFEQLLTDLYGDVSYSAFQAKYEEIYTEMAPPLLFPNCVKMLQVLKQSDIMVAIVTNKSRVAVERELSLTNVNSYIDSIWVAEEFAAKPSPVMLHHAMTSHQLSSSEVWMVGDSLPDLYSGYAANVGKIVLVEDLPIPKMISQAVIIKDLGEIVQMVRVEQKQNAE